MPAHIDAGLKSTADWFINRVCQWIYVQEIIDMTSFVLRTHKVMPEMSIAAHPLPYKLCSVLPASSQSTAYHIRLLFPYKVFTDFSHIYFFTPLDFCQAVLYYYDVSNRES